MTPLSSYLTPLTTAAEHILTTVKVRRRSSSSSLHIVQSNFPAKIRIKMKTLAIAVVMVTVAMVTASPFSDSLTGLATAKCQAKKNSVCANKAEGCGRSVFMNAQQAGDSLFTLEEVEELRNAYFDCAYSLGFANKGDPTPPDTQSFTAAEKQQVLECAATFLGKLQAFVACVNGK